VLIDPDWLVLRKKRNRWVLKKCLWEHFLKSLSPVHSTWACGSGITAKHFLAESMLPGTMIAPDFTRLMRNSIEMNFWTERTSSYLITQQERWSIVTGSALRN
jgi:hypothetical protein